MGTATVAAACTAAPMGWPQAVFGIGITWGLLVAACWAMKFVFGDEKA